MPPSPTSLENDDKSVPAACKKRKAVAAHAVDEAFLQYLRNKQDDRMKREEDNTDEDHFGRHVAAVLKRLPNRPKAMARLRIEQVLMEAEFPETPSFSTPYNYQY